MRWTVAGLDLYCGNLRYAAYRVPIGGGRWPSSDSRALLRLDSTKSRDTYGGGPVSRNNQYTFVPDSPVLNLGKDSPNCDRYNKGKDEEQGKRNDIQVAVERSESQTFTCE